MRAFACLYTYALACMSLTAAAIVGRIFFAASRRRAVRVVRQDPLVPHAEIRAPLGIPVGRVGSNRDTAWTS